MGRLILSLEGSRKSIDKLREIYHSEKLSELLGISVLDLEFDTEDSATPSWLNRLAELQQWMQNIFESTWQEPQLVLAPAYRGHGEIQENQEYPIVRAKEINLESDRKIALVVKLKPLEDEQIEVLAQLHSVGNNVYIPTDLTLSLLDEMGEQADDAKPDGDRVNYIQLYPFIVSPGEYFSLEVTCGEDNMVQYFVF